MQRLSAHFFVLTVTLSLLSPLLNAGTIQVGSGRQYQRLQQATAVAKPGDTILLDAGVYSGGDYIENLHGTTDAWIFIRAEQPGTVLFRGNTQAFHISEASYLRIEGLAFEQQTGNGVNIDDGGTYNTPTHHLHIENCEWRSMNATGNNDELKLSGIDDFTITRCTFRNGSEGGSMIDMVGCHRGSFTNNRFENAGSNAIQAKGATSEITIHANRFINCGQRAVNVGGSTGLQFFRPLGALYEAKNISVTANIFTGSVTPIAFVGAVDCSVHNNTFYKPTRWAFRILQETTETGFLPCGNNSVRNNIIVLGNTGTVAINVGANTAPETFTFEYNLWFNPDNPMWTGPNTPVVEPTRILNKDPMFTDTLSFAITQSSPAFKAGKPTSAEPVYDFNNARYNTPRSMGAVEFPVASHVDDDMETSVLLYPNPATGTLSMTAMQPVALLRIINLLGEEECTDQTRGVTLEAGETLRLNCSGLARGVYMLSLRNSSGGTLVRMLHRE
ncbi:MAG: right-handed parallel beta-helix repeat-containing protein [Candidatus Kapabacteria bacterium]|nr:right-handed parallel beta-helix repeat-containing protein [Candidatus Kapabacteria bacterium]